MAYSPEQRRIIARIKRIGREVGASPKEIKAALETGRVEANFTNPAGGDADSQGWRQERASLYSNPQNLDASIRRFYRETSAVKDRYGRAGDLAAAVQRPAAQYRGRYQGVSAEAQRLLGPIGARAVGTASSRGGGPARPGASTRTTVETTPGVDNRIARGALVQSFLEDKGADILDFAMQARQLQDIPATTTRRTVRIPGAAGGGRGSTASPSRPGATRGGGIAKITGPNPKRIVPQVRHFMQEISAVRGGKPVVGSDGTGHSYLTVNGTVSEHSTGHASDIPARGQELIQLGQAALIAAGWSRKRARAARGGLYNVNRGGRRYQIIFNTQQGGDHTDHLHVGVRG